MIASMDDFVWFLGEYDPLIDERLASREKRKEQ